MQHDLVCKVRGVVGISLAPVVAYGIGEDVTGVVEACCRDCTSDFGVALETVLSILVPEVECAVAARCAEGAMLWVEGDGVDGEYVCDIALVWHVLTVALEGEVGAVVHKISKKVCGNGAHN